MLARENGLAEEEVPMKKPIVAALLSALIIPGAGHLYLQSRMRGLILLGTTVAALTAMVAVIIGKMNQMLQEMEVNPLGPPDPADLAYTITQTPDPILNVAPLLIVACWIIGIIDSFLLGQKAEKTPLK